MIFSLLLDGADSTYLGHLRWQEESFPNARTQIIVHTILTTSISYIFTLSPLEVGLSFTNKLCNENNSLMGKNFDFDGTPCPVYFTVTKWLPVML